MPTTVIEEIAEERKRQIEDEGWTHEHDDQHGEGAMAAAAGCYALNVADKANLIRHARTNKWIPLEWPWHAKWWRPKDRRRDLIRAAALLVAEIERLDRALKTPTPTGAT